MPACAGLGGHDQFTGADNICGDDEPGANMPDDLKRLAGRRGNGRVVAAVDDFAGHWMCVGGPRGKEEGRRVVDSGWRGES